MYRWVASLSRRRVLVPVAVVVVLACAAAAVMVVKVGSRTVTGSAEPVGDASVSATVGPSGVDLVLGPLTVRGETGVAPDGTVLTASMVSSQPPANLVAATTSIGSGVDLSLGGHQPARPLQLTFRTPGTPPQGQAAVVITVPSDGSPPRLIPATYSAKDHTTTASVDHLSRFWPAFLEFGAIARKFTDFLTQTTGLTTARPSCAGKSASNNGLTVAPAGGYGPTTRPAAWPCVTINGSTVSVELTSNSPLPWRVRAAPHATLAPQGAIDPNGVLLLAAYQTLVTKHPYAEGLLIPSETVTYQFDASNLPGIIQGTLDVGTWLGMDLLFAFTEAIDAFGINLNGIPQDADAIGCLGNAVTAASISATPSVAAVSGLAKAVLACIGPVAKAAGGSLGVAGLVIGILTSGVALVVGGVEGIIRTATGTDTFSIPISVSGAATQVVQVRPVTTQGRLAAGYTVDKTVTADSQSGCVPGSEVVGAAYRCFGTDNFVYDPCWPDMGNPTVPAVICLIGPWSTHVVRLTLGQPVDPPGDPATNPKTDQPWGVRLTNGQQCAAIQGTHDMVNGQVVDYFCGDNKTVLLRGVNRMTARWTMASARYDGNGTYTLGPIEAITTAWYGLPTP